MEYLATFKMKCTEIPINDIFQFGKGDPTTSTTRAYLPCIVGNTPFLIGTAILPENIPMLGSHSLLKALDAVIDFPKQSIFLGKINAQVRLRLVGGHVCMDLFDHEALKQAPRSLKAWSEYSEPTLWESPDAELILLPSLAQADPSTNCSLSTHAIGASGMDDQLETCRQQPEELWEAPHGVDGESGASRIHATAMVDRCHPATGADQGEPGHMPAPGHQEVRQRHRSLRDVPSVRSEVGVGQRQDGLDHLVFPKSWLSRLLVTVLTIATAVIRTGSNRPGIDPITRSWSQSPGETADIYLPDIPELDQLSKGLSPPLGPHWDEHMNEVNAILDMPSPLEAVPENLSQMEYLTEECHRETRERMEREADIKRYNQLVAIGVLDPNEVPLEQHDFDWDLMG